MEGSYPLVLPLHTPCWTSGIMTPQSVGQCLRVRIFWEQIFGIATWSLQGSREGTLQETSFDHCLSVWEFNICFVVAE